MTFPGSVLNNKRQNIQRNSEYLHFKCLKIVSQKQNEQQNSFKKEPAAGYLLANYGCQGSIFVAKIFNALQM